MTENDLFNLLGVSPDQGYEKRPSLKKTPKPKKIPKTSV